MIMCLENKIGFKDYYIIIHQSLQNSRKEMFPVHTIYIILYYHTFLVNICEHFICKFLKKINNCGIKIIVNRQ